VCRSIDTIWITLTPIAGIGLICVLFAKKYTLKRNFVKQGQQKPQEAAPVESETKNEIPLETPVEGSDLEKGINTEDSVDGEIVGECEKVNTQTL